MSELKFSTIKFKFLISEFKLSISELKVSMSGFEFPVIPPPHEQH